MNSSRCDRVLAALPPRAIHTRAHALFTIPPQDKELASHRLVLYSSDDPRRKANAALLMALYVVINRLIFGELLLILTHFPI